MLRLLGLMAVCGLMVAPPLPVRAEGGSLWPDAVEIEAFLREAQIVERVEIGTGVTDSDRVTLRRGGRELQAILKKFDRPHDSWRREVAAYELDKLLGLGMVPPTVERRDKGRLGCLQLWTEGTTVAALQQTPEDLAAWRRQVSEMWLFDYLTANTDRHLNNALISVDDRLVLIDNSMAFKTYSSLLDDLNAARGATRAHFWMVEYQADREPYPTTYRQELLARLGSLQDGDLKAAIGRYFGKYERRWVLERRDAILRQIQQMRSSTP